VVETRGVEEWMESRGDKEEGEDGGEGREGWEGKSPQPLIATYS
jgi:hypothetical protein